MAASFAAFFASKLVLDTDLASLLPEDNKSVRALEQLRSSLGVETPLEVTVHSPDFETNKAFAEAFIPKAMELYDSKSEELFVSRYEYRREVEILKDYALYFTTDDELEEIRSYLEDRLEKARLEANPFFIDFEDDFDDDDEEITAEERLNRFKKMYEELIPSEYLVNEDSTSLMIRFYPIGSQGDINYLKRMFGAFEELIAEMNPVSWHPDMIVRSGGRLERHLMEFDSIINDVLTSFGAGISSVILLVGFYFMIKLMINYRRGHRRDQVYPLWTHILRFPVPVIIIGIPLLISLFITFALAYFVYGTLNTMTSVLFVILFGLGIDYGIHFYARYLERRSAGEKVREALLNTYESTGLAIMISASTTAAALFVLLFADFRGFSEFGFISGTGIILSYLSMLFIMPSIIVIFERYDLILLNRNDNEGRKQSRIHLRYPFARTIFITGTLIVGVVLFNLDQLYFEYNFSNLEPEYPRYEEYRDIRGDIDRTSRRNPAYILADTDNEIRDILKKIRQMKKDNPESTILAAEALQERFPVTSEEEEQRLADIRTIEKLLDDPFLRDEKGEYIDILRRASTISEPLSIDAVPDFLKNRFLTSEGEMGRFVMVYPAVGLSDGKKSIAFKNEIGEIQLPNGNTYHAASTSIVAAEMLELMRKESPYMVAATFVMIFILVNIGFRSLRWSLIAMLPLLVGLSWTFGAMILMGLSFNMYNLVVLPAILGIGNDNGVHLASRYREEGKNNMYPVIKSTGQHISIGSITTMLGFAGLLFTYHPGLTSIGVLAVIGIGLTLLSALTFLPALVELLQRRGWIRF